MIIRLLSDEVVVSADGRKATVKTLDVINSALDSPVEGGISVADFRARIKIDKAIEKLPEGATELELSDFDFLTLQKAAEGLRFNGRTPIIKAFIADLFADKVVEVEIV